MKLKSLVNENRKKCSCWKSETKTENAGKTHQVSQHLGRETVNANNSSPEPRKRGLPVNWQLFGGNVREDVRGSVCERMTQMAEWEQFPALALLSLHNELLNRKVVGSLDRLYVHVT